MVFPIIGVYVSETSIHFHSSFILNVQAAVFLTFAYTQNCIWLTTKCSCIVLYVDLLLVKGKLLQHYQEVIIFMSGHAI